MSKPITLMEDGAPTLPSVAAARGGAAGPGAARRPADASVSINGSPSSTVRTMPTMPPAGLDRIASLPWKPPASARPPDDCMKYSRTPGISAATSST